MDFTQADLNKIIEEVLEPPQKRSQSTDSNDFMDRYKKCYSAQDMNKIFQLNDKISKSDFEQISPALIYMKASSSCKLDEKKPSKGQITVAESQIL